ncbi:MAG: glycosyltransferase [Verrucomicrobiae bacterium]|nr:glycosyltransferase [Verrucomicrobiae bacterium]
MILGGAQENTLLTLEGLRRDTPWEIHLAYGLETGMEGSLVAPARELGVVLRPLRFMRRDLHPLDDLRAYLELKTLFRRERYALVHTHSSKAGVLGRIAARRAGVPHVIHTIHGLAFDEWRPAWRNAIYARAERLAARHCDAIVSVCDTMGRLAREAGAGAEIMRTIPSGFAFADFLRIPPRPPDGRFVVGVIARMFPFKGHEEAMLLAERVLPELNDVDFLIVGDGPLRGAWDAWHARHPEWRSRVAFAGRAAPRDVPAWLAKMDFVVHLSWREALARVIPQAFAAGRAVCATDVGGTGELVVHGRTGWLVPAGDLAAAAQALREARADLAATREKAEAGKHAVEEKNYDARTMQRRILDLYREMGMR